MSTPQQFTITAQPRELIGKVVARLRRNNFIPAVLYGHDVKPTNLSVPKIEFEKIYRAAGESTILQLKVGDSNDVVNVLIHDIQKQGVTDDVAHIDFYQVKMTEKLTTDVPLKFVGEAPAVKELGGTFVHQFSEIKVESLPGDLPHEIEINISGLKTLEDVIRVKDLSVDRSKVRILADDEQIVAGIQAPRTEAELEELKAVPVAADVTQVEGIIKPEKPEETTETAEPESESKKE